MSSSMLSRNFNKLNISNGYTKYIIYFLSIALILGYIVKDEMYPLIFFIIFSGIIYYFNKSNQVIALLSSIILTNLLIVLNIF